MGAIAVKLAFMPTKIASSAVISTAVQHPTTVKEALEPAAPGAPDPRADKPPQATAAATSAPEAVAAAGKAYQLKKLFYDLAGGDLVVSKQELLQGLQVG